MVCPRCISSVHNIFDEIQVSIENIELGKVYLKDEISPETRGLLAKKLELQGFQLLDNHEDCLINAVKTLIINKVHYLSGIDNQNLSKELSHSLNKEYSVISKAFSKKEGITIQQYLMKQRIEKVKEYLDYNQKTISEIAFELGFSSVAHLSTQFKKLTGISPSEYKNMDEISRKSIDNL